MTQTPTVAQFSVRQEELASALADVGPFVGKNSPIPIVGCYVLSADKTAQTLYVTGTDLGKSLRVAVHARVSASCSICIPAKLLAESIGNFPPDLIDVSIDDAKWKATFKTKAAKVSLAGHNPADYPLLPSTAGAVSMQVPMADLRRAVKTMLFFAGDDNARPNLTGILFDYKGDGRLLLAATDGYRLDFRYLPAPNEDGLGNVQAIIPATSLDQLVKLLAKSGDTDLTLEITDNSVHVALTSPVKNSWTHADLYALRLDARFPDYTAIVPKTHKGRVGVKAELLKQALRTVATIAKAHGNDQISIALDGDTLVISATANDAGDSVFVLDTESVEGTPATMMLQRLYLVEALTWFDDADIVYLETEAPVRPIVVVDHNPEDGKMIIMPMHPPR